MVACQSGTSGSGRPGQHGQIHDQLFRPGAIKATLHCASHDTARPTGKHYALVAHRLAGQNAFATEVINADDVKPVVIGEGIESLSNAELTREKREDIR